MRLERVSPAPYTLDITTTENLLVNANAGNDTFNGSLGLAPLIKLTVDGGPGNDTLNGGDGADCSSAAMAMTPSTVTAATTWA